MRVIYVVCAGDNDYFCELAALSVASLRISNPHLSTTIVTDRETLRVDSAALNYLRDRCNEFLTIDVSAPTIFERSRYLKCSLTNLIDGAFLALDSDTLVFEDLKSIAQLTCDVAAAPDLNSEGKSCLCQSIATDQFSPMGWDAPTVPYLNSGVVYFSGNPMSRKIGQSYMNAWNEYSKVMRRFNDQAAFNRALHETRPRLALLDSSYNAQISMNPLTARGAKIVHFFTGGFETSNETVAHVLAKQFKSTGLFDMQMLTRAVQDRNPWTSIDTATKAFATHQPAYAVARFAARKLFRQLRSAIRRP